MRDLSKFFVLSLALHLVGGGVLTYIAATLTPKGPQIMIIDLTIDSSPSFSVPLKVERKEPAVVARRVTPPPPAASPAKERSAQTPRPVPGGEALPVSTAAVPDAAKVKEPPATGEDGARKMAATAAGGNSTGSAALTPAATASGGEFSSGESATQRFLKEHFSYIRDMVARQIVYPPMARKMGWAGRAVIAFTVSEDGNASSIRLVESSGFPLLDRCALETVHKATPFPRPPCRAEITIPVQFRLM